MSGVPEYKAFIVPFLRLLEDGQSYANHAIIDRLAVALKLTDLDKSELVKCGRQYKYRNRIIAARTYLLRAKLIEYGTSSSIFITEEGKKFLQYNISSYNQKSVLY